MIWRRVEVVYRVVRSSRLHSPDFWELRVFDLLAGTGRKDLLALIPDLTSLEEGRSTTDEALELYHAAGWLWVVLCLPFFLISFGIAMIYDFAVGNEQPTAFRLVVLGILYFPVACGLLSWTNYFRAKWLGRVERHEGKKRRFQPLPFPWLSALSLTLLLSIITDLTAGK